MKRTIFKTLILFCVIFISMPAFAVPISTSFSTSDGFITGDPASVTLSNGGFSVTFSGGQQQQMFDGPSYNVAPDAYLFINGTGGFNGADPTGDKGLVDFNIGVTEVSFFAADRGNGNGTIRVFGLDDMTVLATQSVTQDDIRPIANPMQSIFSSADFGGQLIGSIEFDNAGPAGNPPYVLAIDSFSATPATAIPIPPTFWLLSIGMLGLVVAGRKKYTSSQ